MQLEVFYHAIMAIITMYFPSLQLSGVAEHHGTAPTPTFTASLIGNGTAEPDVEKLEAMRAQFQRHLPCGFHFRNLEVIEFMTADKTTGKRWQAEYRQVLHSGHGELKL